MTLAYMGAVDSLLGPTSLQETWLSASGPGMIVSHPQTDISSYGLSISDWERAAFVHRHNDLSEALVQRFFLPSTGASITYSSIMEVGPSNIEPTRRMAALDCATLIATIRSELSLQMKELAAVIGVERPTVYAWLKGHSTPQRTNREHLHRLYRVAKFWRRLSPVPLGKYLRDVSPDGSSLLEILGNENVEEMAVQNRLGALAQSVVSDRRSRVVSVRELASRHRVSLDNVGNQQGEIDVLTGKRVGSD